MKRILVPVLMLALLICLPALAAAQSQYYVDGIVYNMIPTDDGVLIFDTLRATLFNTASGETRDLTFTLDGRPLDTSDLPFEALFGGVDGIVYGAIREYDGSYTISRGTLNTAEGGSTVMTTIGPLPWEGTPHVLMQFSACREGILALCNLNLFCWNPDTGATFKWPNCKFQWLTSADGRLISYQIEAYANKIVEVSMANHSISTLFEVENFPEHIAVSPDGQRIAYLADGIVTAHGTDGKDIRGYYNRPISIMYSPSCLTNDGVFAIADGSLVTFVPLSEDFDPLSQGLVIGSQFYENTRTTQFRQEHQNIPITSKTYDFENMLTPARVGETVRSRDSAVDVFLLSTADQGFRALLEKGYCADLSDVPGVAAKVNAMPESIRSAVTVDGKIYAVPYDGQWVSLPLYVSTKTLNDLGLTLDDVPANMDKLLDTLIAWIEDGTLDNVRLHNGVGLPGENVLELDVLYVNGLTLASYIEYYGCDTPYPNLNDPAFRALMEKSDRLVQALRRRNPPDDDAPILFPRIWTQFSDSPQLQPQGVVPIPIAPFAGGEPRSLCRIKVAVMNPLSQRQDDAKTFLAALLNDMDARTAMHFWPNDAVPVAEKTSQAQLIAWNELKAEYARKAEDSTLDEGKRREARDTLDEVIHILAEFEQGRWLLPPEEIENYLAIAPSVHVLTDSILTIIEKSGGDIMRSRYLEGQADISLLVDTYIRINRTIAMEDGVILP